MTTPAQTWNLVDAEGVTLATAEGTVEEGLTFTLALAGSATGVQNQAITTQYEFDVPQTFEVGETFEYGIGDPE